MKTPRILTGLAALVAALFVIRHSSFVIAQGPLTPPGAPAPTMKTLDQLDAKLEKRTPISTAPFTITTPGTYYLTVNLAVGSGDGITISANDVTLDLNGATISSTANPAVGRAIVINGIRQNITVRNGHIRGTTTYSGSAFTTGGFLEGVGANNANSTNIRISELNVVGMGSDGIDLVTTLVPTFVVERCNVAVCAGQGIRAALIRDCAAETTGDTAILADIAMNCSGETVNTADANADGVAGTTSENCRGIAVSGTGVTGSNSSNSRGLSTSGTGLFATTALNCYGVSTSGTGLVATNATNCYGQSTNGPVGLDANPGTASFCRGSRPAGTAIDAGIAIGCTVLGTGTVNSVNKFLGTP